MKIYQNGFNQEIVDACIESLKFWYGETFNKIESLIITNDDTRTFYNNPEWIAMKDFVSANKETHKMHMRNFWVGGRTENHMRVGATTYTYAVVINETWEPMPEVYTYDDEINGATPVFIDSEKQRRMDELTKFDGLDF
jgi:hypothetical protein